jgi:ribokinase
VDFDIITIGSATIDVFAKSDSQVIKLMSSQSEEDFIAFRSGDKVLISDLHFHSGGGGTNTAVSFSRLGLNTGFIGKIGSQAYGDQISEELLAEQVRFLGSKNGKTGYSIIFESTDHDRVILTYKGSNNDLHISDIPDLNSYSTKWLYASSMLKDSFQTLITLINHFKKQGARIAFNPSLYQTKEGLSSLHSILSLVDVLILNKEEAESLLYLTGDADYLAIKLSEHVPAQYVVITDGARGAVCAFKEKVYTITSSPKIRVVDTTGAGDAFASAFVTGLIKNYSLEESLILGMTQAEHVISAQGAKNLLTKETSYKLLPLFKGTLLSKTKNQILKRISESKLQEYPVVEPLEDDDSQNSILSEKTTTQNFKQHDAPLLNSGAVLVTSPQEVMTSSSSNDVVNRNTSSVDISTISDTMIKDSNHADSLTQKSSPSLSNNESKQQSSQSQKKGIIQNISLVKDSIVSQDQAFILSTGEQIRSLHELKNALKIMRTDVFFYHVHEGDNHFTKWIREVYNYTELANSLDAQKTKIGMQNILDAYVD